MAIISKKKIEQKVAFHLKYKIPYTLELSGSRVFFRSSRGDYMSRESKFLARELSFIKSVKDHIIKNEIYNEIPNNFKTDDDEKKIKYHYYNKKYKKGDIIKNGIEIDLKSAYWETINYMNALSPEIYEKGKTVSKKSRLAAIGSLAKKSRTITFNGQEEKDGGEMRDLRTKFIWDTICYKVGKIMAKASKESGKSFVFFWVDAIFISGDEQKTVAKKIISLFNSLGYKAEMINFEELRFEEKKIIVKSKEKGKWIVKKGERIYTEERPFPFKKLLNREQIEKLISQ